MPTGDGDQLDWLHEVYMAQTDDCITGIIVSDTNVSHEHTLSVEEG